MAESKECNEIGAPPPLSVFLSPSLFSSRHSRFSLFLCPGCSLIVYCPSPHWVGLISPPDTFSSLLSWHILSSSRLLNVVGVVRCHGDRVDTGAGGQRLRAESFSRLAGMCRKTSFEIERGRGQGVGGLKWLTGSGTSITLPSSHPYCCHFPTL